MYQINTNAVKQSSVFRALKKIRLADDWMVDRVFSTDCAVLAFAWAVGLYRYPSFFSDIFRLLWSPAQRNAPYALVFMFSVTCFAFFYFSRILAPEDWPRMLREKRRITRALIDEYVMWDAEDKEAKKKRDADGVPAETSEQASKEASEDAGLLHDANKAAAKEVEEKDLPPGGGEKRRTAGGEDVSPTPSEEPEKEEKDGDKEQKRKPPSGQELFEILWDEIEAAGVTGNGVDENSANYKKIWALFKERLKKDFEKVKYLTELAKELDDGTKEWTPDVKQLTKVWETDAELALKEVQKFNDGTKLQEQVDLYRTRIEKAFGKGVVLEEEFVKGMEDYIKSEFGSLQWSKMAPFIIILRPYIPIYIAATIALSFESAVSHVVWHGMHEVLDNINDGDGDERVLLTGITSIIVKLFFVRMLDWVGGQVFNRIVGNFRVDLMNKVMAAITRQDTEFFDFNTTGVLQQRLGRDVHQICAHLFRVPRDIIRIFCHVSGIMWTIWKIDTGIFVSALIPIPALIFIQMKLIKYMRKVAERLTKMNEKTATKNAELLKEIRTVREFVMEKQETKNYFTWNERKASISESRNVVHSGLWSLIWLMFVLMRIYVYYLGGGKMMSKVMTFGQVLQVAGGFETIMHCLRHLSTVIPDMIKMMRPMGRICNLLALKPEIEPMNDDEEKRSIENVRGEIEFIDVHFTFPIEPNKPVLKGLSFVAKPGEKVAFVGHSGCGKSTAFNLIESFYRANKGQVLLDGNPIDEYCVHDIRGLLSIVAQSNVMFSTTIRENILYGIPMEDRNLYTTELLIEVCKKANAWEFICEFPRKLETFVGERGQKLSGGQKQRLAIARAIIRKPKILLLDEATSALDVKAEKKVQEALDVMLEENKAGCSLIIAHRLTTIRNCDKIVVFDKGRNVEVGTHDELMNIPIKKNDEDKVVEGIYHDLWITQMKEDTEKLEQLQKRLKFMTDRCTRLEESVLQLQASKKPIERVPSHELLCAVGPNVCNDFNDDMGLMDLEKLPAPKIMQRYVSCPGRLLKKTAKQA